MAKGNSKGSDRAKREQKSKNRADAVSAASAEDSSKMPRRYRKQLRILERALADAARLESRRLLKLERARYRRQMIEAVLEELRPGSGGLAHGHRAVAVDSRRGGVDHGLDPPLGGPAQQIQGQRIEQGFGVQNFQGGL